jgi:hypothetical protein
MTIAAVGLGPLGLLRVEFSGPAAVVWNSVYIVAACGAESQPGPLTLFENAGACRKMGFRKNSLTPHLIDN